MGGERSCCQGESDVPPAEVILPAKAKIPEFENDQVISNTTNLAMRISFSEQLAPVEEEDSDPNSLDLAMTRMKEMRHMESDYAIMRGIPLHQTLRRSELWTSPHEIRRRNRSAQVWHLSSEVSQFDIFLSHTWRTKGRWKVLALMMQTGWCHALLAWFVGVAVMLLLRAFELVDDPWKNGSLVFAGEHYTDGPFGPWTVIVAGVSLLIGLCLSPYLPFKTQMCFLDVACIHQGEPDMFRRGIYAIGGCLSVAKELRVLYSPEYLSSLWCLFEITGFRQANPEGKVTMAPLFMERSVAICAFIMWCAVLSITIVHTLTEVEFRQTNILILFAAVFFLPIIFVVHAMRYNYRDKKRLISDLKNFDLDKLRCTSDFDRAFIFSAIDAWYGSREAFRDFVQSSLREELLNSLPSPRLPYAYAAFILSSPLAWVLDTTLDVYKAGLEGEYVFRRCLAYLGLILWFWCAFNGIFYLSDISASFGRTVLLDWSKTFGVAGVIFLWILTGFALLQAVNRSGSISGLVCFLAFSVLLPFFVLDGFRICRKCRRGNEAFRARA